ncbi:hypothetical protein [Hydrogenophaga sp. 2FB]|uniref:hypothetical protein n=1 Tax=Hydrogenophaga sp. 2FB TaxID=2502187 RepID=UPI0010F4FDFF|nr:hypothetical protein [Hydrogenophaga sp. 2FB]
MGIAVGRASRIPESTITSFQLILDRALAGLGDPALSEQSLHDLRFACVVSSQIELIGIVKGLGHVFKAASTAIEGLFDRCSITGDWLHQTPTPEEMTIFRELVEMNVFQLSQLSRAEFERVFQRSKNSFQMRSASTPAAARMNPSGKS